MFQFEWNPGKEKEGGVTHFQSNAWGGSHGVREQLTAFGVKDLFGVGGFLIIFLGIVFFVPDGGGYFLERPNFIQADPLVTPEHITPAWYFGAFYAMLRAVPSKAMGVITMGAAVLILFAVPWLDRSKVRSIRYKGWLSKIALAVFSVALVLLSYYGLQPPSEIGTFISRLGTVVYFAFFLLMPFYTSIEKTKPEPERVTG